MMNFKLERIAIAFLVAVAAGFQTGEAQAQTEAITFSRTATSESNLAEIDFRLGIADDVEVAVDQLGVGTAFFQNNDNFGRSLFGNGDVTSLAAVAQGDTLAVGDMFGSNDLDIDNFIVNGEDFFVGFSSNVGGDEGIGYFRVSLDSDIITYSEGFFTSESIGGSNASLTVAAIPEPASAALLIGIGILGLAHRRRIA